MTTRATRKKKKETEKIYLYASRLVSMGVPELSKHLCKKFELDPKLQNAQSYIDLFNKIKNLEV